MRRERFGPFTVDVPETLRERARGLMGRDALAPDEGLLLRRCRSVHTFGMRFTIEPGRILLPRRRVRHVLEVAAGRGAALSP